MKRQEIDCRFTEIPTPKQIPATRKEWIDDILSSNWDAMGPVLQTRREDLLAAVQSLKQDTVVFTHEIVVESAADYLCDLLFSGIRRRSVVDRMDTSASSGG